MASKAHILAFPARNAAPTVESPVVGTREVTIASGLHSGATFPLQEGDLIVVGADVSCDICLSDAGMAPRHAAIVLHGGDVLVRSLDGAVNVNGESARVTQRVLADSATVIFLEASAPGPEKRGSLNESDTAIPEKRGSLDETDTATPGKHGSIEADIAHAQQRGSLDETDTATRGKRGPFDEAGAAAPGKRGSSQKYSVAAVGGVRLEISASTSSARTAPQASPSVAPPAPAAPTLKKRAIFLIGLSLFAILATMLVAKKLDASLSAKPGKADIAAVQALLNEQGLAKALTVSMAANGVEVKGVLDRQAATKLRGAIAGSRQPIIDSVVTKEDLIEQVRDVFRTQGYDARVTHIDGARVQVDNLDEINDRVRQATERVRADVPQLETLIFVSPDDATPPQDAPPYGNSAGDRIVTRIDGKTAYLVAGAGTRYFKGSKLPSGHTIRRITREAVQLERDGQIDWFRF